MSAPGRDTDDLSTGTSLQPSSGSLLATPLVASGIDDDSFAARPVEQIHAPKHDFRESSQRDAGHAPSAHSVDEERKQDGAGARVGLGDVLVISGGSGYNALVGATPGATHIMPVSDDGGSSSEIIRVLGGPSIGDLRSRLVRLIPTSSSHSKDSQCPPRSNDALHALLSYRLPTQGKSSEIKQEWMDILEGRHHLWRGIEPERKECIRGFLVHFESEILRRVHRNFDFRGGSIGNFFLAAAQKFFRSLQSAIFLFSATSLINSTSRSQGGKVLPVINTNHTATIAAILANGKVIVGQCDVSHPSSGGMSAQTFVTNEHHNDKTDGRDWEREAQKGLLSRVHSSGVRTPASGVFEPFPPMSTRTFASKLTVGRLRDGLDPGSESDSNEEHEKDEADDTLRSPRKRRKGNIVFSKEAAKPTDTVPESGPSASESIPALEAPISRLFYVNAYGNEVAPAPNPDYLSCLRRCKTLVYSCGSLWTSIVPCIALRGVARAIAYSPALRHKVLILNTTQDRETQDMCAMDYLRVLQESMQHSDGLEDLSISSIVTHVIYSPTGTVAIDVEEVEALGVRCVPATVEPSGAYFNEQVISKALDEIAKPMQRQASKS